MKEFVLNVSDWRLGHTFDVLLLIKEKIDATVGNANSGVVVIMFDGPKGAFEALPPDMLNKGRRDGGHPFAVQDDEVEQ